MNEQLQFLQHQLIAIIQAADPSTAPQWGKMNFQQMVEHVTEFFQVSTQKQQFPFVSDPAHLPKLKEFLMSDKPFRENTKAPTSIIGETPFPIKHATATEAVNALSIEVHYFFQLYQDQPTLVALHPVFGELNYEEWVRLHYKHVTHHLRQFGLV